MASLLTNVAVLGPEYQRALHNPKPEIGWKGDPDLTITHHQITGWEVLREEVWFDYKTKRWETRHIPVARQRPEAGSRLDIDQLLKGLVDRDTNAGSDHKQAMAQHLDNLAKEEQRKADEAFEAFRPVHEKLAWTIAKETGSLSPVVAVGEIKQAAVD